jgi:hypothetical protein
MGVVENSLCVAAAVLAAGREAAKEKCRTPTMEMKKKPIRKTNQKIKKFFLFLSLYSIKPLQPFFPG